MFASAILVCLWVIRMRRQSISLVIVNRLKTVFLPAQLWSRLGKCAALYQKQFSLGKDVILLCKKLKNKLWKLHQTYFFESLNHLLNIYSKFIFFAIFWVVMHTHTFTKLFECSRGRECICFYFSFFSFLSFWKKSSVKLCEKWV